MNCSDFRKNFSAYLEGELERDTLSACETHLKQCTACSRLVQAYSAGKEIFARQSDLAPPEDLLDRVKRAASATDRKAPAVTPLRPRRYWIPAAAAAVMVAALSLFWLETNTGPSSFEHLASMEPTMDIVNIQHWRQAVVYSGRKGRDAERAYPVSSSTGDEVVLSYGVSWNPVIIQSGVSQLAR